jgi:hypothetical protein
MGGIVKENNELSFKRVVLIPAGQALIMGAFIGAAAMSGLCEKGRYARKVENES